MDEVGNSDLKTSDVEVHRYLSLTGIIFSRDYSKNILGPTLSDLKRRHFRWDHPDDEEPLHRKEIMAAKQPFSALKDDSTRAAFNKDVLELMRSSEYTAITVVIDKKEHASRYKVWRFDPFHYSLQILLERYAQWLDCIGSTGDVLAESRGGREDLRLKQSYSGLYLRGTDFISPRLFQQVLTSSQLKVKPKSANLAGLQFADLIAHPSFRQMKCEREGRAIPSDFGTSIVRILMESKYHRSPRGEIDGWGRKWLP